MSKRPLPFDCVGFGESHGPNKRQRLEVGMAPRRQRQAGPSKMKSKLKSWKNSSRGPKFTGRGDYKTTIRAIGRAVQSAGRYAIPSGTFRKMGGYLGAAGGGYLAGGNPTAMMAGSALGGYAGDKFSELVGFGDYEIKANSLMNLPMGTQVASFGNMSNATIIKHREFIRDISIPTVPGTFNVNTIEVNPGLRSVFPWLSSIAGNYQEYQFIGCIFEFRSLSSDSASTLPMGSIIIASNYDTSDPSYPDKRHMENSQFCVSGKPSKGLIHPIECDPKLSFSPIKYVRSAALDSGVDHKLFDHVNVQIATEGLPAAASGNLGELWVSYEVALYKPNLGVSPALRDHFFGSTASVGAIDNLTPFGATPTSLAPRGGDFGGIGVRLTASGVTFPRGCPPGKYEVSVSWVGAAGFLSASPAWTASTNVAVSLYYLDGTVSAIQSTALEVLPALRAWAMVCVEILQPLNVAETITMAVTFDTQPTSYDLQVAALPTGQT